MMEQPQDEVTRAGFADFGSSTDIPIYIDSPLTRLGEIDHGKLDGKRRAAGGHAG